MITPQQHIQELTSMIGKMQEMVSKLSALPASDDINQRVLNAHIVESDAGDNITVKDYLKKLLSDLWDKEEGFNGKRPFGNSGWSRELYIPLVKAGLADGSFDHDGCIENYDEAKCNTLIFDAIDSL